MESFASDNAKIRRGRRRANPNDRGYAIILALVVLAALVAIATPFLMATRGSARSSAVRSGDVRARIEADSAARAIFRRLEATDPENDTTPGYDTNAEVRPILDVPKNLYPTRDPKGVVVSAAAEPEQVRININSASVGALGLLFPHSHLVETLQKDGNEVALESADGFPDDGVVWIDGELIRYRGKSGGRLTNCERGVMGSSSGPYESAGEHAAGVPVVDARAHSIAKHRIRARNGEYHKYETVGEITRAKIEPEGSAAITPEDLWKASNKMTVFSERNGHEDWSAPTRITSSISADGAKRDFVCENARYLGVGTTVKVEGPEGAEYGIVVKNTGDTVTLEEPLRYSAQAFQAKVSTLIPSPIHIHSASVELLEDMLTGLCLRSAATPEPISREAARQVANKIQEVAPKGWKDLIERVLLPLATDNVLTLRQVEAVLRNGENSNDYALRRSTLPFTFVAGSRYRVTSSASVNAPSGAERGRDEIECVAEVHRQNHDRDDVGIRVVARQTEFDELLRLSRRGRGWMTYPWNSCYFDGRTDPPARVRAYLMNLSRVAGDVPIVQSEDPNISWAQLWPSRSAWPDNKSEHFDTEIAPEGRDVSKFQAWTVDPVAAPAELVGANGYLYPGAFSGWFRWDGGAITGTLFDLGSKDSTIRDRVTLAIDQGDLVLRMRDTCGDDTNNIAGEIKNEIRFPAAGQFQANVWYHFTVVFRGSGPGDFALLIDGLPRGKRGLLTHLSANLQSISQVGASAVIPVESTDGFPGYGILEIGDELVEYSKKTAGGFSTAWATGNVPGSYTGGRGVRLSKTNTNATHSHQAGEVVKLYGYANRILRDVYPGGGQLSSSLGRFSAGKVRIQQNFSLTPIDAVGPNGFGFPLGKGIKADAQLNTLRLDPLDASDTDFIKAFPATGGYAVMFQFRGPGNLTTPPPNPAPIFGAELIQFSGVQGTDTLVGITRNVNPGTASNYFKGTTFVVDWANNVPTNHKNNDYRFWTFVVPCSIPVSGGSYYKPTNPNNQGDYGVAQLIELGAAGAGLAETTEWVQYDTILNNHLCALADWRWDNARAITLGPPTLIANLPGQQPPVLIQFGSPIPQPTPGPVTHTNQESIDGRYIGMPMPKGVAGLVDQMQFGVVGGVGGMRFRGTNQTWSRDHQGNTEAIPAFITKIGTPAAGRPGRLDRFRIVLPSGVSGFDHRTINWTSLYNAGAMWIAAAEKMPNVTIPVPTVNIDPESVQNVATIEDSRDWVRIVVGPSGELPAVSTKLSVGGAYDGTGDLFAGTIDELEFMSVPPGQRTLALGRLLVAQACTAAETTIQLCPAVPGNPLNLQQNPIINGVSYPGATKTLGNSFMGTMPADAGVVMIGDELIGYDSYDPGGGTITVAQGGRGILGTQARAHGAYETAIFLHAIVASQLSGALSAGTSVIEVEDPNKFPPFGTVLVEDELMHYTRNTGARLEMPEFEDESWGTAPSGETGVYSAVRRGNGLFRGRYGTVANAHSVGHLVFRFPYRYWDRWVIGSDAPELFYIQCDEEAQAAFWRRVFWKEELPLQGVTIECLVRLDGRARWSAQPNKTEGLWLFTSPNSGNDMKDSNVGDGGGGDGNPILRQGERLELRFGVRFGNGAFDPIANPNTNDLHRSDAWKVTPRLRAIAVERFAGNRILWKEERR